MAGDGNAESDVIAAITPVFRSVFEDDNLVVTRQLDASQVKDWDSLNHITLIVELEQMTRVRFSTDELAVMAKVGDLIDVLIAKGYRG